MGEIGEQDELVVYSKILNFTPEKSRPTHYELIGIAPTERDAKRIEAAARKRIQQLRQGVSPELLRAARVVLKKIERAQTCLLDAQARASYDIAIGGKSIDTTTPSIWDELEAPAATSSAVLKSGVPGLPKSNAPILQPARLSPVPNKKVSRSHPASRQTVIIYSILATAATAALGFVAFAMLSRPSDGPPVVNQSPNNIASAANSSPSQHKPEPPKPVQEARQADSRALTSFQERSNQAVSDTKGPNGLGQNRPENNRANGGLPAIALTLAALPEAAELPAQRGSDSALPPNQSQPDGPIEIGPVPPQGLNVTIDQPMVMTVNGISFDVTSEPTANPGPAWEIRLRSAVQHDGDKEKSSLDNIAAGLDEVVARVYVENGKLKFVWTKSKYSQLAEQLRNCVLCFTYAQETHRIQLRPCQKVAPVVLDFEKVSVTYPVSGDSLPSPEVLFLEVQPSSSLASKVSIEPNSRKVACNKLLTIKALGDGQQKIEIRAMLKKSGGGFVIVVAPRFQVGSDWQPFTTDRVNSGLRGLETALQRHRDGLDKAKQKASSTASELSSAQSQLASAKDAAAQHTLTVRVHGLQNQVVSANRSVSREEKAIPDTEQDLARMKKLVDAGNKLRGSAELRLKVSAKTNNGEYDLVRTDESIASAAKP